MRTLVCVQAQVRTAELTWPKFKENVLDVLGADLALCIGDSIPRSDGKIITSEYNEDNGFFHTAKYIWRYNEPDDWACAFDLMTEGRWRDFTHIPGNWLGPAKTPVAHSGTGGINTFFRWFLSEKIGDLMDKYDQIIITRSDYYWIKPHPVLDLDHVWIPNGEFHGGICDRHAVLPMRLAKEHLSIGSKLGPEHLEPLMAFFNSRQGATWMLNNEIYLYFMYRYYKLHKSVGFFPFKMFSVSVPSPNQSGVNSVNPKYPGLLIRYPDELDDAEQDTPNVTWPWQIDHGHVSRHGFYKGKVTKNKFAVCSLAIGAQYKESIKWCCTSQEMHANRHGYPRITDETVFVQSRDATWSKIPLLQKYLPDYEYVMWIDGDVLITNQERKIEEFIDLLEPDKFLLIGRDFQGLNAGVFVMRNCPLALEFLADAWKREELARVLFHEQTAMTDLLATPKYAGRAHIIPHRFINIINAYDYRMDPRVHWTPGDFCIHFAGIKDPGVRMALQEAYMAGSSNDPSGRARIDEYIKLRNHITKEKIGV